MLGKMEVRHGVSFLESGNGLWMMVAWVVIGLEIGVIFDGVNWILLVSVVNGSLHFLFPFQNGFEKHFFKLLSLFYFPNANYHPKYPHLQDSILNPAHPYFTFSAFLTLLIFFTRLSSLS